MQLKINWIIAFVLLAITASPVFAQSTGPDLNSAAIAQTGSNLTTEAAGCSRIDIPATNAVFEAQVVELVNQARWNNGQLLPLKRNTNLDLAARYHAKDMHDDNYFEHDTYDGKGGTTWVCSWSDRISNWYTRWDNLAENIAYGQPTPGDVVNAWMNSAGHRANILSADLKEIGVGFYENYWAQDFGSTSSVYPLVINREAANTDTTAVTLDIYGESYQFPSMRLKNDDETWSAWMPYSATIAWELKHSAGLRTVTVELRRANGTTVSASDTINLTKSSAQLGGVPDRLDYIYNIALKKWISGPTELKPTNIGNGDAMDWTVSKDVAWINLNQQNGVTPSTALNISVNVDLTKTGSYDGSLTITVSQPSDTTNAPKTIPVHVQVVNLDKQVFLPAIIR